MSALVSTPLLRLARGDQEACSECIVQYGPLVWALARRYTFTNADAQDATQEIFISLWRSATRFDPSLGSDCAFIATIARRRLMDARRRHSVRRTLSHVSFEDATDIPVDDVGLLSSEQDRHDAEVAMRVLRTLRPEFQRVLNLAFAHGMTQAGIAQALTLPIGTVKSHMRRGLLEIRAALNAAKAAMESEPIRRSGASGAACRKKTQLHVDNGFGPPFIEVALAPGID